MNFKTIRWVGDRDGHCELIEQTRLPDRFETVEIHDPDQMIDAILRLAVRGAPALGVAGAYGVCLATRGLTDAGEVRAALERDMPRLADARPTAVNLRAMVERMERHWRRVDLDGAALRDALLDEAKKIHAEDVELCAAIGRAGAEVIPEGGCALTHCNAGALATAGSGTALSVFYAAKDAGKKFEVFADETRPLLQGSRLTAWELSRADIPVTVICDNAAAHFFQQGKIDVVVTGADRVVANGDSANKIGTYGVACLAKMHNVPFYIAAPSTTFDFEIQKGEDIPIEERSRDEVWWVAGKEEPQAGIEVRNPAFDVTPAGMIAGWITEKGILQPPFDALR